MRRDWTRRGEVYVLGQLRGTLMRHDLRAPVSVRLLAGSVVAPALPTLLVPPVP